MEHITNQITALRGELTTPSQKSRLNKIQQWTQSEIDKLRAQVERLSINKVNKIEVVEAVSNVTRLTVVPKSRTTLKISPNIKSEKVRKDLVELAEYARDHYSGYLTARGTICFDEGVYLIRLDAGKEKISWTLHPFELTNKE